MRSIIGILTAGTIVLVGSPAQAGTIEHDYGFNMDVSDRAEAVLAHLGRGDLLNSSEFYEASRIYGGNAADSRDDMKEYAAKTCGDMLYGRQISTTKFEAELREKMSWAWTGSDDSVISHSFFVARWLINTIDACPNNFTDLGPHRPI